MAIPHRPCPRTARRGRALPFINADACTGCGRCVAACPPHVLSLRPQGRHKQARLDRAPDCTGCALCFVRCPFDAIRMVRRECAARTDPIDRPRLLP